MLTLKSCFFEAAFTIIYMKNDNISAEILQLRRIFSKFAHKYGPVVTIGHF